MTKVDGDIIIRQERKRGRISEKIKEIEIPLGQIFRGLFLHSKKYRT